MLLSRIRGPCGWVELAIGALLNLPVLIPGSQVHEELLSGLERNACVIAFLMRSLHKWTCGSVMSSAFMFLGKHSTPFE